MQVNSTERCSRKYSSFLASLASMEQTSNVSYCRLPSGCAVIFIVCPKVASYSATELLPFCCFSFSMISEGSVVCQYCCNTGNTKTRHGHKNETPRRRHTVSFRVYGFRNFRKKCILC